MCNQKHQCVACKSEIFAGASICPICKSYQSRWKRIVYYCATIAGLITVVFSLLTYMLSTLPEVYKRFFWRDLVEVTAFDSKGKITIHNSGDGKVFVSHLSLRSEKLGYSQALKINKTVESKSFLVEDFGKPNEDMSQWGTGPLSEDQWRKVLSMGGRDRDCFRWRFFYIDDPFYQTIKSFFGNDFHSLPCDATLIFHSGLDGHRISRTITIYAVPFWKRTEACAGKDSQTKLPASGMLPAPR